MLDFIQFLFSDWIQTIGVITGAGAVLFLALNKAKIGWTLGGMKWCRDEKKVQRQVHVGVDFSKSDEKQTVFVNADGTTVSVPRLAPGAIYVPSAEGQPAPYGFATQEEQDAAIALATAQAEEMIRKNV